MLCKSKANFDLALELKENGKFNAAANRFYYSVFQAVKAYAVLKGKMGMDDRNDVHATASEIVKNTEKQYHRTIRDACNLRIKSDYLKEDVGKNELDLNFVSQMQSMRNHFETLANQHDERRKYGVFFSNR